MQKVYISQPSLEDQEEYIRLRWKAEHRLEKAGYKAVNPVFSHEWFSPERMDARGVESRFLVFKAKTIEVMSRCHAVYFCAGWQKDKGCQLEHLAAQLSGRHIIEE